MTSTATNSPPRHPRPSGPRTRLISRLPVEERRIELAGVSTAVLEGGEGPPILALHGPGEFAARWLRVIPKLASTNRVIVPDLPGHGASSIGDDEPTAQRVVAWLDALVEHTCAEPPALVGHILGGAIAARFALERPQRLRHLVLVDSLGLAPFRPSPKFALSLVAFMALPGEGSYHRLMGQCEYDRDSLAESMGDEWHAVRDYAIELARDADAKSALRTLMSKVGVPAIPPSRLAQIAVPTTLIWGRHDKALRLSIAEAASERYGWPLHVIEGTADDAPLERPEAFVEALREALTAPSAGIVRHR